MLLDFVRSRDYTHMSTNKQINAAKSMRITERKETARQSNKSTSGKMTKTENKTIYVALRFAVNTFTLLLDFTS